MYDPREPQNSYHGSDPFLSDSFDDLNTNYNPQDPLFPGESNQPPTGPSNTPIPPKNSGRGLTAALIVVGSLLIVAIVGGGLVFALSRGSHGETVAQSSDSRSEGTVSTSRINPPPANKAPTKTTNSPEPTVGAVSDDNIGNDYANKKAKQWSESSLREFKKERPTYHTSENFEWLEYPNGITPGTQIINRTKSRFCSAGYIVRHQDRLFVLTAGHCGEKGDVFAYATSNKNLVNFGRMVDSIDKDGVADYGLIEITNSTSFNPSLISFEEQGYKLSQWMSPQNIRENERVCRLGYRTGLSCGDLIGQRNKSFFEFRGTADHGDSGGPAFVIRGNNLIAVGLETYGFDTDATRDGAVSISDALDYWGLELMGS